MRSYLAIKRALNIVLICTPLFVYSEGLTEIPESISRVIHYTYGKVIIVQGSKPGYSITGKGDAHQAVSISFKDETLSIEKKWLTHLAENDSIVILVTLKSVSYLSVSGSGSIETEGIISGRDIFLSNNGSGKLVLCELKCENLDVSLSGSGLITLKKIVNSRINLRVNGSGQLSIRGSTSLKSEIRLSSSGKIDIGGAVPVLNCVINGSGDLNALNYNTKTVTINVSGSGSSRINTETLIAKISGSGNVYYAGMPSIELMKSANGRVAKIE